MSGTQVVGPSQALDNTQVIMTDDADYQVNSGNLVIISSSATNISCTLPFNPKAGETHRFVATFTGMITLIPNVGQIIIFNDGGPLKTPGATPVVFQANIGSVTWNNQGAWVADCCIGSND